jgi:hypothetical protein
LDPKDFEVYMVPVTLSGCGTEFKDMYPLFGYSYMPHESGCPRCNPKETK